MKTQEKGKWGEDLAHKYLVDTNYIVLFKNWRFLKAEIDLIAYKDNFIVFVEVKTRKSDFYGRPIETISEKKIELYQMAASSFLETNNLDLEIRFDAIEIIGDKKDFKIELTKDFW